MEPRRSLHTDKTGRTRSASVRTEVPRNTNAPCRSLKWITACLRWHRRTRTSRTKSIRDTSARQQPKRRRKPATLIETRKHVHDVIVSRIRQEMAAPAALDSGCDSKVMLPDHLIPVPAAERQAPPHKAKEERLHQGKLRTPPGRHDTSRHRAGSATTDRHPRQDGRARGRHTSSGA
jgi:hypothetical protein